MNEILESLYGRKSVRVYEARAVPDEVKRAVLEAAVQAPSACNQQRYTILDITDQALKARLAETCDHQGFIARAPVVLIFLADNRRWLDAMDAYGCGPRAPGPADLMLAVSDAVIAAQNAVAAAQSLGLGSCYIGNILANRAEHRALLGLPEYVFPAAMLVLGWPAPQQRTRPKPARFPAEALVCENTYRPTGEEEREALFARKAGRRETGAWLDDFCRRMYNCGFCRGMNRSVEAYWAEYRPENTI